MRKLLLLAAVTLFAMPVAYAQQRQDDGTREAAADTTEAGTGTGIDARVDTAADERADAPDQSPGSGFGQVMSVLTGLLQEAAQREATGRSDGFALDNPAIEISVTPVEGRTSLLRAPAGKRTAAGKGRRGADARQLAGSTPH